MAKLAVTTAITFLSSEVMPQVGDIHVCRKQKTSANHNMTHEGFTEIYTFYTLLEETLDKHNQTKTKHNHLISQWVASVAALLLPARP